MKKTNHVNVKEMNFDQLFKQISPEEIGDNVFTLVGKNLVITAGKEDHYNSMTASLGGLGILFRKPTTWCILRADRYTLEIIQKEQHIRCLTSRMNIRNKYSFWEVNQEEIVRK